MTRFLWSLMAFFAVAIALYAFYILYDPSFLRENDVMAHHLDARPWAVYGHIGLGALALAIGPFQFLTQVRTRAPELHRTMGRTYVVACLLAGVCGIVLALRTAMGPVALMGFASLGILWLVTTSFAFTKARARDFTAHRVWMVRSYALTYAAVALRIYIPVGLIAGFDFSVVYPLVAWACWVPNLIFAEIFLRKVDAPVVAQAA
ncbi:DUF2306 domain-containing protein [Kordiimonas sp.]|uniref:DUF2306 domain-containing protein n=1 Tax=Kordiimonas sp. TaxID=1970157 RepID=UPI003A8E33D6